MIGVCFSAERIVLPWRTAWIVLKFTASAEFKTSRSLGLEIPPTWYKADIMSLNKIFRTVSVCDLRQASVL